MKWLIQCWQKSARAFQKPPLPAGEAAEIQAAAFLKKQGLRILARNFRCKGGELDIVALEGDTLVFAEVRLRSHAEYGGAAASLGPSKQRRVRLAAQVWLKSPLARPYRTHPKRFDALLFEQITHTPEWIRNAF